MDSWLASLVRDEEIGTSVSAEGASLRDINTIAQFTSSSPTKKSPNVCVSIKNGHTCIGLDSSVVTFSDSNEPEGIFNSESMVDCLALSDDATFLIMCLNDGSISLMHLPLNKCIKKWTLMTLKQENNCNAVFKDIFFLQNSENETSEILILSEDILFHFVNIQLEKIKSVCAEINSEGVQNILAEIDTLEVSLECNGGCVFTNFGCHDLLLIWDEENVNLMSLNSHQMTLSTNKAAFKGANIIKARIGANGREVFILDNLQTMNIMCFRTFLVINTFSDLKIDDFTLIESVTNSSVNTFETKVLLLTGFKTSACAFYIYQFPSFKLIYSVDLCPYTYVIDVPPNHDCILFLEGRNEGESEDIVTSLKLRRITEASPEAQLSRLLNKRLFEEAMSFALNMNMNTEVIFQTKAKYLIDQLHSTEVKHSPQNITPMKVDLYNCLDNISDLVHVITFCINAKMPSLTDTMDMLLYAKSKLGTSEIVDRELCSRVFQILRKLETFKLIHDDSQFRSSWDGFMRANLWEELLRFLFLKKLDVASLLWEQHSEDFLIWITKNDVILLLNSIPEALISHTLCLWLRSSVLPAILSRVQDSLECVAAWIIHCSSSLELTDKTGWPDNAINFAQMLLDVCQDISSNATLCSDGVDIDVALQIGKSTLCTSESMLSKLHILLNNLHDLKVLWQTYSCKITLADYSQENKRAVVSHLLELVHVPELPKFMNFLKQYASRNGLNADEEIMHYITDIVEFSEISWWLCEEPQWEKQVIALIHCLEDEECYLNSICKMLQVIPVPWSQSVHDMVNRSLKSKNPLVENINLEIGNITKKTVLMKYGFQRVNLSDDDDAEVVMRNILVNCADNETAMNDALVIVKNSNLSVLEAFVFRIKHLVYSERFSECLSLMKSLDRDISVPCCKRLAIFARELNLSMEENKRPSSSNYWFTKIGIYALNQLKSQISAFHFEDYEDLLKKLESTLAFQANFGVYFNLEILDSKRDCLHIFESNVKSFLSSQELSLQQGNKPIQVIGETERKQCDGKPVFQHLFQIADLLNLSRITALEIIAKNAFVLEKYDLCIDVCGELCYPKLNSGAGEVLGLIRYIICEWSKTVIPSAFFQPLINTLSDMVASAAIVCEPDLLEECAHLGTWISLLKMVRYKTRREDLDFSNVIGLCGTDPYSEWTYTTVYKENSLQVDLGKILPKLAICIQNDFHEGNSLLKQVCSRTLSKNALAAVTDMIRQLKLNGQSLLAYSVYVESISMFLSSLNETNLEILSMAVSEKQKLTLAILHNVFGQSRLDYSLALGLLLNLPKAEAIVAMETVEQRSGYDYRKLQHIAIVGEEYSRCWADHGLVAYYRELQKESEWGRKFSQLHINFKDAFRGTVCEKMKLLYQIANQAQITLPAIRRYCSAFNLDLDQALLITLDVLLTSVYDKQPRSIATRQTSRSRSQALSICILVMREIGKKKLVFEKLNATYLKIDPYNYEILEFILENILSLAMFENGADVANTEKGLVLLRFLKTYKRISEPSEFEIELWLENSEFCFQNEQIKERLPFHSLLVPTEAAKILVSELTATTVDAWLRIANCLKLQRNEIIMMTVENLVRQIVPKLGPSLALQQAWVVMVPNKQLLYVICDLISRIDDLEKATACATSVVKRLPPSYCKVYATMGAISFAKKWWESTHSMKSECAMKLLRKLHSTLYSDQILYEHGLNEPLYTSLNEQPEELICRLFEHPSIVQRYWLDSNKFPDIHSACEKIAGVTQCDLDGLRLSLLNKWILPPEYLSSALDETIIEDFCVPTFDLALEDEPTRIDENLKRSIYLLQRGCVDENAKTLVNLIFTNSSTVSNGHKLRALKCLLHIADVETIRRLTNVDICGLRILARNFFCGSQLEHLGLSCELPRINELTAARDLAIQLLQSQSHNPVALSLAADLCLHSKFYNLQIWNTILWRMIDSKAYKPLREVLFFLSSHSMILQSPVFFKAWSAIIKDDTMDVNEPARGFNKLVLLHRCPFLHELDLLSLAEYFSQVSLFVLAIDCFLHLPDRSSGRKLVKDYLNAHAYPSVLQHLKELRDVASSLYHLDEITREIFLSMDKKTLCDFESSSLLHYYEDFIIQRQEL